MVFVSDEIVAAVKLNAATFQAWTVWVPSVTSVTVGSGTEVYRYTGGGAAGGGRLIVARGSFVLGAGSAITGSPSFTLPFASVASGYAVGTVVGNATCVDANGATHPSVMIWLTTTTVGLRAINTGGASAATLSVSSTVPFTWVSTDSFDFTICYEAA